MASILKVTITTDVSREVLNKEAGELVKEAIKQIIPAIIDCAKKESK